jgi:hypothetical protein
MATIDIDLDDINHDDLIEEVIDRLKPNAWNSFREKHLKKLQAGLSKNESMILPYSTLEDQMKCELLKEVWDKYSSAELERRLI